MCGGIFWVSGGVWKFFVVGWGWVRAATWFSITHYKPYRISLNKRTVLLEDYKFLQPYHDGRNYNGRNTHLHDSGMTYQHDNGRTYHHYKNQTYYLLCNQSYQKNAKLASQYKKVLPSAFILVNKYSRDY